MKTGSLRLANSLLIFAVILGLAMPSASALAAPQIVQVVTAAPTEPAIDPAHANDPRLGLEVSVTEATTAADLDASLAWAEKDLAQAQAGNSAVKPQLVVAAPAADGTPEAQPIAKSSLRQKASELFSKHYRVTFALIRGVANTTVVTWGLIISAHVALAAALPVGIIAGSMSAGLQYFNQKYNAWMLKSKTMPGQFTRNYVTNVIYMAITRFVSAVTHVPQESSLAAAAGVVLKSSLLGTFAQGTWSLAFAKSDKLQRAQHPEKEGRIQKTTDFKAVVNSMVSTGLTIANLMGAPMTDAAMLLMGGAGAAYYGYVAFKERKWVKSGSRELLACEQNLVK